MNYRKAFTLVELLVVISIIALLLAILMPALNQAREQGKAIYCGHNLKQVGLGLALYYYDYRKYPSEVVTRQYWTDLLDSKHLLAIRPYEQLPGKSYIETDKLLCRSQKPFAYWQYDSKLPFQQRRKLTYVYNAAEGWQYPRAVPSSTVFLGDGKGYHLFDRPHVIWNNPSCILNFVHSGKLNLLFVDSHVERVAKQKVEPRWFYPTWSR